MANLRIYKGDADTLTEVITGLDSLAGYTAKLYVTDKDGLAVITKTGSINTLTITYEIVNEDTKDLDLGSYLYETKLYDVSDHVYTPSKGKLMIMDVIEEDPS